jgi:hypothetical protein
VEVEVARASTDPSEPANQDADQNLAEMAQRLEAALRRPGGPSRRDEPAAPIPETVTPLRQTRPERPVAAAAAEPKESRADGKPSAAKSLYESLEQEMASLLGRPAGKP